MKHGCTVMTLRLSIGSSQIHHSRKKCVKFAAMSSPCWSFFWHPRHCPQGIRTPWSNRQWQVLLWGFEAAQMSRQVEEKQLVSPPWQRACSHITHCSTIPDFQKHSSYSPPPYSSDLAPCNFFLFPKVKLRLKGCCFDMTEVINTHLRTSRDAWNHGKHAGITVYIPNGTTPKEMVETFFGGSDYPNFWVAPPSRDTLNLELL